MEPSESDAAGTLCGRAEDRDGYHDVEHLPPLLEDEENVSLADILSLRDSCLSEEEVWAVCAECAVALRSIRASSLFHSLCITPDTLAFNAHGNVCFMEQLSDDPEGSFVPPEFDNTGSTYEGHVYSLGSTLSAALSFVIEPELEADLGPGVQRLLEHMQEESPEDRPLLQEILSQAEESLSHTSSAAVCRKLSAVGRRVLSIESVTAFQDGQEGCWEARWQHPKPWGPSESLASDENAEELCVGSCDTEYGVSRQQVCGGWDSSLCADDVDAAGELDYGCSVDRLDCRSHDSSPVRGLCHRGLRGARGALNRSCSVPDSNNPPCGPHSQPHGDISVPVCDLTEIGEEDTHPGSVWSSSSSRARRLDRGQSCTQPHTDHTAELWMDTAVDGREDPGDKDRLCGGETDVQRPCESEWKDCTNDTVSTCNSCEELDVERDRRSLSSSLCTLNNHMTKSMLCLNEESQDEWITLRELLSRCGRRLTVNELWALCFTCLSSLQTYIDFPAYLCLDTVHVGCEGEVLFLTSKNIGSRDEFYLAPEYQEHGIVTEKVCVYAVAAILWATAKFSLSANQKLAMPRKLKRLLLEMAKRTAIERPTIALAKKICRDYLSRQGTDAETVWSVLIGRVHQPATGSRVADGLSPRETQRSSGQSVHNNNHGLVPTESRLAPVPGPVPHSSPRLQLPGAFTSGATHFSPIVLTSRQEPEDSPGADTEGPVDGFTQSSEHVEERGLDHTSPSGSPSHTEPRPPSQQTHVHQAIVTPHSAATSVNALASPASALDTSRLRVSLSPSPLANDSSGFGIFNNYLFRQDPATGHLSIVPVRLSAPESVPGLDIDLSLLPQPLQTLMAVSESRGGPFLKCPYAPLNTDGRGFEPPSFHFSGGSILSDKPPQRSTSGDYNGQTNAGTKCESVPPAVHPALQEVIHLLRGEFSLHDCLGSGHQDISMGEYIFSLKDLQYQMFADVVRERFSDLYWEEDLLGVLHCLASYGSSAPGSNEKPPSKAVKRAALTPPSVDGVWAGREGACPTGCCPDVNGNLHTPSPDAGGPPEGPESPSCDREHPDFKSTLDKSQQGQGVSVVVVECVDVGVMQGAGDHSAGASPSDESPSEAECLSGPEGPEGPENMEDSDSPGSPGPRAEAQAQGQGCHSAWGLAFYGEACYGPDVVQYAQTLGQHTGTSHGLDLKTQELQQQLIIETRNLKKTRNFYQKLIQQERQNKGSDSKLMLPKLKSQYEELRSKVVFLECVKKYLEIVSVEQWGLELSLLASLAVCGPGSLDLQSSSDTSVLSFGSSHGKSTLQAGTPEGLMSYLYARNAAMEGYIQQFLYTYRYFCTPEQLLGFIMDKFISAARQGPDMSGDCLKVFHRSLDLLHFWIADCGRVDFTSDSGLVETLEMFLNTEVIPVDSRGEALLTALHHPPSDTQSQSMGSLTSLEEYDDDSTCLHSSTEDLRKKWRFSRVVEPSAAVPRDKTFSIAAALPLPCYGSMVGDSVGREEGLPFCHHEYSALHLAQQLTLLQQEMFQGCHPVHFLNSRTQGVRHKALNQNQNVPPAEGSSGGPVCEGTPRDGPLQQLLSYSDRLSNWISAELLLCDSVKAQAALLTKYLYVGKHCYECRNFGTAMQVLGGLENGTVRHLAAWKHLPSKVCEILEELRAVQVFLKSDDLCLMGGDSAQRRPTLPSAHILAVHVQQLERGALTLTSGAYKWTKLRSIGRVVSQVQAFQESSWPLSPDSVLQAYLRRRVAWLSSPDLHLHAPDNQGGDLLLQARDHQVDLPQHASSERQTRRIQDTLRRVKATFQ